MTVEQQIIEWVTSENSHGDSITNKQGIDAMHFFAKLKCEELLLLAAENAKLDYDKFDLYDAYTCEIDKKSILNVVDLDEFIYTLRSKTQIE